MDDSDVLHRIRALVAEEHDLERSANGERTQHELARIQRIEVALDQCWDLLRQRRARRRTGEDPDEATARTELVVEGYQQ